MKQVKGTVMKIAASVNQARVEVGKGIWEKGIEAPVYKIHMKLTVHNQSSCDELH